MPSSRIDPRNEELVTSCARDGRALPKLTFPGQNSTRPLSTLPLTGTITHITSLSLSIAPNVTTTRVNPPLTPVISPTFTQVTATFSQVTVTSVPTTIAPSTATPTPTNTPSTNAGLQTFGCSHGMWWVWVALCLAVGSNGLLDV